MVVSNMDSIEQLLKVKKRPSAVPVSATQPSAPIQPAASVTTKTYEEGLVEGRLAAEQEFKALTQHLLTLPNLLDEFQSQWINELDKDIELFLTGFLTDLLGNELIVKSLAENVVAEIQPLISLSDSSVQVSGDPQYLALIQDHLSDVADRVTFEPAEDNSFQVLFKSTDISLSFDFKQTIANALRGDNAS